MRDTMGWHRDWGLGVAKVIGSVGIGVVRDFMCMACWVIAAGRPGFLGAH